MSFSGGLFACFLVWFLWLVCVLNCNMGDLLYYRRMICGEFVILIVGVLYRLLRIVSTWVLHVW